MRNEHQYSLEEQLHTPNGPTLRSARDTRPTPTRTAAQTARANAGKQHTMAGGMMLSGPGGRAYEYNRGRMTLAVLLAAAVGAACGLLFG